jgi:hypothetical protein
MQCTCPPDPQARSPPPDAESSPGSPAFGIIKRLEHKSH